MSQCVYLEEYKPTSISKCLIYRECVLKQDKSDRMSCDRCKEKLFLDDDNFTDKFVDSLYIIDRLKNPTHALRNLLAGRSAFLICGGPSANDLPLNSLNNRGCWTMTVNNVGGHKDFRPNAFVCSDPPSKNGLASSQTIGSHAPRCCCQ